MASGLSLSYAPQYAALQLGFFRDEGLDLSLVVPNRTGLGLVDAVVGAHADMLLGSAWFSLVGSGTDRSMSMIAESNRECHHAVASQHAGGAFEWGQLRQSVVLLPTEAPTAWVALTHALRLRGLSLDQVRVVPGLTERDAKDQLMSGVGDHAVLPLDMIVTTGLQEVATLASVVGPIPWSVYCVPTDAIPRLKHELSAFVRGLRRGLEWVRAHSPGEIAEALEVPFGSIPRAMRELAITRYVRMNLWSEDGLVEVASVERWGAMLLESGLLRHHVPVAPLVPDLS